MESLEDTLYPYIAMFYRTGGSYSLVLTVRSNEAPICPSGWRAKGDVQEHSSDVKTNVKEVQPQPLLPVIALCTFHSDEHFYSENYSDS
jgi:hypothetical protein